jgi:hypothetical protein
MGDTPPVVQTEELGNNSKRLHVSFSVPARVVDYRYLPIRGPHPMVAIAVTGDVVFYPREDRCGEMSRSALEYRVLHARLFIFQNKAARDGRKHLGSDC